MTAARRPRRVAVLSTYATHGGAARSALRHHLALRSVGVESTMVTAQAPADGPLPEGVVSVHEPGSLERDLSRGLVNRVAIERNRTEIETAWFSWPLTGYRLTQHPAVEAADAISVHWVSGLLSLSQFEELFSLGKPVVLTMHDEWLFTGGCHYTGGCGGFRVDCARCPQLAEDPIGVPARVLQRRIALGEAASGAIVTPSRWLGEQSSRSAAFRRWPHTVLPYACDTSVFHGSMRHEARAELGLDDRRVWLVFVADNLVDRRKGLDLLSDALHSIDGAEDRFSLLCAGWATEAAEMFGIETRSMGMIADEHALARVYAAADALVLPSREDNLPNTMVESLCCGTPVIGSSAGGIPDFVEPGKTGFLFPAGDAEALARVLLDAEKATLGAMRPACREVAEAAFEPSTHAERWLRVAAETTASAGVKGGEEGALLHAAYALAEARLDAPQAPVARGPERIVRVTLERQLRSTAERLRESERDRADRLAHIHRLVADLGLLRETLAELNARRSESTGTADAVRALTQHVDESHTQLREVIGRLASLDGGVASVRAELDGRVARGLEELASALERLVEQERRERLALQERLDRGFFERLGRLGRRLRRGLRREVDRVDGVSREDAAARQGGGG